MQLYATNEIMLMLTQLFQKNFQNLFLFLFENFAISILGSCVVPIALATRKSWGSNAIQLAPGSHHLLHITLVYLRTFGRPSLIDPDEGRCDTSF